MCLFSSFPYNITTYHYHFNALPQVSEQKLKMDTNVRRGKESLKQTIRLVVKEWQTRSHAVLVFSIPSTCLSLWIAFHLLRFYNNKTAVLYWLANRTLYLPVSLFNKNYFKKVVNKTVFLLSCLRNYSVNIFDNTSTL